MVSEKNEVNVQKGEREGKNKEAEKKRRERNRGKRRKWEKEGRIFKI